MEQSVVTREQVSFGERLRALRRRWKPLVVIAAGVLLCATVAAFLWPASYRSSGTILIEQQEVPTELVRSTISSYADQRIQVISQRVMTTENLMRIVQKYDLYAKARETKPREVIVEDMRDDIEFETINANVIDPRFGHPTKATIAFSVSYQNRSPLLAARVANELVSLYMQENIENRKQRSAETTVFLKAEADRLSKRIAELDAAVAIFKERHVNELPELSQLNLQLMSRTDDELSDLESRIRSLDQQIVYLDAQLAQINPTSQIYTSTGERVLSPADRLKYLRTEYARASGIYAPDHPDIARLKREMAALEKSVGEVDSSNELRRQLADAKTQLKSAQQRYSSDHPDVLMLQRLVQGIEEQLTHSDLGRSFDAAAADNPAYIQVKAQREASVNERQALEQKRSALKARQRELEQRITQAPAVERDYMAMARELDNSQLKYREIRQKQMEAELGQNLEEERKGERFTLIEPPLVPERPASPNRLAILVLGAVLALAASFGSVALLELTDPRVRGRHDLEKILALPPLAILPWIETNEERRLKRKRVRYAWAGALGTFAIAIVSAHFLYRPLDVLWTVAMRRLLG